MGRGKELSPQARPELCKLRPAPSTKFQSLSGLLEMGRKEGSSASQNANNPRDYTSKI